jgi:uncharacterized 2Fe-2S/4Fe-4S cluster protein (DUF4445 family)
VSSELQPPQCTVQFQPSGRQVVVPAGTRVSDAAEQAGVPLSLPCGGHGKCGKCRVTLLTGELTPPDEAELQHLKNDGLALGVRLACVARVESDCALYVTPAARVIGDKTLAANLIRSVELRPGVRQYCLELPHPSLSDQRSDFRRLVDDLEPLSGPLHGCVTALRDLPAALRNGEFRVCATFVGRRLVDVDPAALPPRCLGAAVDIGTTTVVAYIMDLLTGEQLATAAAHNPQARHGADVISRIEYANTHPDGLAELQREAAEVVNQVVADALSSVDEKHSHLYEMTVVGNTCMQHLFAGFDPRNLAQAPFIPVSSDPIKMWPLDCGAQMHPRGSVYCLPSVAGFVGADTVGVVLAADLTSRTDPVLAVDIGTNGEVALWSGEKLFVASCAAGPAFEGVQIQYGMRAAPGAIESIAVCDDDLHVQTIDDQPAVGICGSGIFDAMASLLQSGLCDPMGRMANGQVPEGLAANIARRLEGEGPQRKVLLATAGDGAKTENIYITQRDVREIQLAKGAVRAAIEVLLKEAGLTAADLGDVLLAGAFGNHISPASAVRIGMLPDIPLERIRGVGNAAGAGAILALLSTEERERATEIARQATHLELSSRLDFQMTFADTMLFPGA